MLRASPQLLRLMKRSTENALKEATIAREKALRDAEAVQQRIDKLSESKENAKRELARGPVGSGMISLVHNSLEGMRVQEGQLEVELENMREVYQATVKTYDRALRRKLSQERIAKQVLEEKLDQLDRQDLDTVDNVSNWRAAQSEED
jgi:rubrerythrin